MKSQIEVAKPGQTVWDNVDHDAVNGLHLKCFERGKSYYLFYRFRGVQRRPKIGDASVLTLTQARKIAKEMLARIAAGVDPSLERQIQRKEKTVNEVFEIAEKETWNKNTAWAKEAKRIYKREIEGAFSSRRLSDIQTSEIRSWHSKYSDKPFQGNRALAVLSKLYTIAEEREWRPQNMNPCLLIKPFKEEKRDRYATREEIKRIGEILEREAKQHPEAVAFLYLLIFSGSRPSAIERVTWNDLSVLETEGGKFGVLKFNGKTGKETVILPPQAMLAIDKLIRAEGKTLTGIKMPAKMWKKIKSEVGCKDLWARDFRRTFASIGLSAGHSIETIGELLNHKSAQTTMIYGKLMNEMKLTVASDIANRISEILK